MQTPLDQAIKAAGGQRALARKFVERGVRITGSAICQWRTKRIPPERVLMLEEITGVSRSELRPDLYPSEA